MGKAHQNMTHPEQVPGSHRQTALVPRLLAGLVLLVCRAPQLVLVLTAFSLAACIYLAATRLQYHTQRDDLISPDKEVQQRWHRYVAEFGQDDDMVVVVQGDGPASHPKMFAALEALASKIHAHPDCFDRLFYKVDLRHLSNRALLFLSLSEIRRIQEDLGRMKRLLDNPLAWKLFSLRGMVAEASGRLDQLKPGQPLATEDVPLLEQLLAVTRSARVSLDDPTRYRNPWLGMVPQSQVSRTDASPQELLTRPQYFLSGDGQLAFLLVRPVAKKDEFLGSHESVKALRTLVDEIRSEVADVKIGLTGLPVLETDEMLASQNDTKVGFWMALAGVLLLYLLVFRTLRSPLLSVSTLIVGTTWALGWMTLTVGHLNLLSATFAVMLIGMGDYGILWVTRYQQERGLGQGVLESLLATATGIGPSTLTVSVTTGLGFFAAMLADFKAVAELGWIAGCGVLFCALACCTFLPALILVVDGRKEKTRDPNLLPLPSERGCFATPRVWLPRLASRPRWVLVSGLTLLVLVAMWTCRVRYDHNLLNLQADSLESVRWERTLIAHTAGASWHALSYTDSREKALELKARFEKLATVERVVEIASLVPSDQEQKLPILSDIHQRLALLPPRHTSLNLVPSSPELLLGELHRLADSALHHGAESPGNARLLNSLATELDWLANQLATMPKPTIQERLHLFEGRVLADLCEDLHKLRDVSSAKPIHLVDLPGSLRERYVSPNGRWLLRVFGKESLWEYQPLSAFVASVQTVDPGATGKPFTTLEGLRAMKHGFQWAGVYSLLAIVLVLFLDFRSPSAVLLVLAPLVAGVLLALGVMGLCGFTLNPANMIALPLIVGVGVNYGVHVIHDFLARKRGSSYLLRRSTGIGILVVGLTAVMGFGTLMLSSHRGLRGLGCILALAVSGSMLMALVFLPAFLNLRSRRSSPVASQSEAHQRQAA
jgi:hopanoid biosynthesis associated RND transporter like protein HpnN